MADRPEENDSEITVLGTAQLAAWRQRRLPPVERLAGGLWSVPVPIPDNPLRYTLCYLVPGDHGLVVVDPGWDTAEGWRALISGLDAAGATVGDVLGIVATHVHPDHHGLSARLSAESGAWVAMHPAERDTLPQRIEQEAGTDRLARAARRLRGEGAPEEAIAEMLSLLDDDAPGVAAMAEPDILLNDGDCVPLPGRRLHALWTPGHTPGHLCLREPDAQLLLTGDHVLPRVTPNVGLQPGRGDKPLRRFLESLEAVAVYTEHEALPAHEYRFSGLDIRVRQLHRHHAQRNSELLDMVDAVGEPSLWELAERMSWARPWAEIGLMRYAALAETAAHADYLVDEGELAWIGDDADSDSVTRLRRAR